ncbi:MAG: hypothetical protein MUD10_04955 [Candidatus Pacebacteria bacterium]|jgi:ribosomal protein S25|nr:hypothetical protein [Candidatus Paceibacterota bacterium]
MSINKTHEQLVKELKAAREKIAQRRERRKWSVATKRSLKARIHAEPSIANNNLF